MVVFGDAISEQGQNFNFLVKFHLLRLKSIRSKQIVTRILTYAIEAQLFYPNA